MGSRGIAQRLLLAAMMAVATGLILAQSSASVESSVPSGQGAAAIAHRALGWEQAFRDLAVGP